MSLCTNPNDPQLVGPVFAPPTGVTFRSVDAASSDKNNVPRAYFPWQQFMAEDQWKLLHQPFGWEPDYHTFIGFLDDNIQAATYQLLLCLPRDATNLSQLH